jgi:hypothetical protein
MRLMAGSLLAESRSADLDRRQLLSYRTKLSCVKCRIYSLPLKPLSSGYPLPASRIVFMQPTGNVRQMIDDLKGYLPLTLR